MTLYLIRHAAAAPLDPAVEAAEGRAAADRARPLTPRGRRRFRVAMRGLRSMDVELERVLHSPLRRAVETADLLLARQHGAAREETELLAASPTEALLERLRGDRVGVVGHDPWLGELLGWLVADRPALGERLVWKKGGVARLEGEPRPGGMRLFGFWAPGVLRRMA